MNTSLIRKYLSLGALPVIASVAVALIAIGCLGPEAGGGGAGPDGIRDAAPSPGIEALLGMGFARDRIVETEDGFVVEDDIFFPKAGFAAMSQGTRGALAKTSQRAAPAVNTPAPNTLRLAIHSSLLPAGNTSWKNAVYQAVNNLNNLKTRLHIDVVPSGSGNITISSTGQATAIGTSSIPAMVRIGASSSASAATCR